MHEPQLISNIIFKRVQFFTVNRDGSSQWTDEALHAFHSIDQPQQHHRNSASARFKRGLGQERDSP